MVQRIKEISYIRAFAALSIILIHASSGYVNTGPLGAALNQFPRYGSPVFVIISGFILYHIELKRPSPSYLHFFKHRFLKVFIPYVIWTVIYTTYAMPNLLSSGSFNAVFILKTYLFNVLTGTGYVHLYFILIMVQLYALFPLLKRAIETHQYATMITAVIISFSVQALIYIHGIGIITLPTIGIAYATLFPGWLVFFCLGIYLRSNTEPIFAFWKKNKYLCLFLWLFLMAVVMVEVVFSPVNFSLRPTVSLYGAATFFVFYLLFEKLKNSVPKKLDNLIEWIANNSFDVYLVHPLVLNLIVLTFKLKGYIGAVLLYVFAVIFTCLFILVLNKLKSTIKAKPVASLNQNAKNFSSN